MVIQKKKEGPVKQLILVFSLLVLSVAAHAAKEDHLHGQALLKMSIEGDTVSYLMELPGNDVVGFEKEPETTAEIVAVRGASDLLTYNEELIIFNYDAGCNVISQKVSLHIDDEHMDFDVEGEMKCGSPSSFEALEIGLFKLFPSLTQVNVEMITSNGMSEYAVTKASPFLDLK